jgi:hypothetical protein
MTDTCFTRINHNRSDEDRIFGGDRTKKIGACFHSSI